MGQKSRRKGAKGTPGGINARNCTHPLSPLKQLDNARAVNINNAVNITPSADCLVQVRRLIDWHLHLDSAVERSIWLLTLSQLQNGNPSIKSYKSFKPCREMKITILMGQVQGMWRPLLSRHPSFQLL